MEVEAMVGPVVEAAGLEFVDATLVREQGRRILRVTVDREGGLDLDSIGAVSDRIARRLDLEGFDPGPYVLEVSSPGLERPLREPRHYVRAVGEQVKLKLRTEVDGSRVIRGTIVSADGGSVRVATDAGEREIPLDEVLTARTVFEWGSPKGERGGPRGAKRKGGTA
jgi:ribosome maturation factor RimP